MSDLPPPSPPLPAASGRSRRLWFRCRRLVMPLPVLVLLIVVGVTGLLANSSGRLEEFLSDKDKGISVIRSHAERTLLLREGWLAAGETQRRLSGIGSDEHFFLTLQDDYEAGERDGWLVPQDRVDFAVICAAFGQVPEERMLAGAPEAALLKSLAEGGTPDAAEQQRLSALYKNRGPDWWTETLAALFEGKDLALEGSPLEAKCRSAFRWRLVCSAVLWVLTVLGIPAFLWTIWALVRHQPQENSRLLRRWKPSAVFGLWLLADGVAWVAAVACGVVLASAYAASGAPEGEMADHAGVQAAWSVLSAVLEFLPVILLIHFLTPGRRAAFRMLGLTRPPFGKFHLLVLGLGGVTLADAVLQPLSSVEFALGLGDPTDGWSRDFGQFGGWGIVLELAVGCLIAPFVEEVVFRGFLFSAFRNRFGDFTAALLSSLLFAGLHYYSILGSISVFMIGMIFCLLYDRSRTLWTSIIAHSLFNLAVTLNG